MTKVMGRPPKDDQTEVLVTLMMKQYRGNAKARGVSFLLSREEFSDLIFSNCFYCGIGPTNRKLQETATKKFILKCNGIDRVNTKEGYTVANCVPACMLCNRVKLNNSVGEFRSWVKRLYEHQFGTPDQ